jgi:MoxR-like ATPase
MSECTNTLQKLQDNINKVIVGSQRTTELLLVCLAAGGHVLIEDVPGTGKTMLAKSLAASASLSFSRIQFTPDLLPGDVTGLNYFDQSKSRFVFREGPVFCHILLADEINRATPRTQSALLECMAEHQVTVDGQTRPLEDPFFVIATQNPLETLGTFPLPEAQLDRFLMRLSLGLPDREEEMKILRRFMSAKPLEEIREVCSPEDLIAARKIAGTIHISEELLSYIADIIIATRKRGDIAAGVSSRGTLALMRAARASAFLESREYVVPEDIKFLAEPVLAHRLILYRNYRQTMTQETILREIIESVPVPTEDFGK